MATKPCYESEPIANLTFAKGGIIQGQDGTVIASIGSGVPQLLSTSAAVAANATGTQASGTPILAANNTVSSAGSNYSVTLPAATPGLEIDILCITGTNTVKVFPAGTDTIDAGSASAGQALAALTSTTFICVTAGAWWTNPRTAS